MPKGAGTRTSRRRTPSGRRGRLMVTSINTLNLEVYYRFLPLYKLDRDGKSTADLTTK